MLFCGVEMTGRQTATGLATALAIAMATALPAEAGLFDRAVSRAVAKRLVAGKAAKSGEVSLAKEAALGKRELTPLKSVPRPASSASSAGASALRGADRPTDVIVHRKQHPEAVVHIEHAQRNGQPTVLTLDRTHASERRGASLRGINDPSRPKGRDRDEYPPAMTREGGQNSTVHFIDAHDNRGAGATIQHQTRNLPDGTRIRVLVTD